MRAGYDASVPCFLPSLGLPLLPCLLPVPSRSWHRQSLLEPSHDHHHPPRRGWHRLLVVVGFIVDVEADFIGTLPLDPRRLILPAPRLRSSRRSHLSSDSFASPASTGPLLVHPCRWRSGHRSTGRPSPGRCYPARRTPRLPRPPLSFHSPSCRPVRLRQSTVRLDLPRVCYLARRCHGPFGYHGSPVCHQR